MELQKINDLKTPQEKALYRKTMTEILEQLTDWQLKGERRIDLDQQKQHRNRINKIIVNGKVNPKVKIWLRNPTKFDIVGIDDISKDRIKYLKYGKNVLTKSERRLKAQAQKINKKRNEKGLVKDLMSNEIILPIKKINTWKKNPKKYDLLGVDTIPSSVAGKVASKLNKKENLTTDKRIKKYSRLNISTRGVFRHNKNIDKNKIRRLVRINRLLKGTDQAQITLGHETGHAYDLVKRNFRKLTNPNLIAEMKRLAEKINPPIIPFKKYEQMDKTGLSKAVLGYMKYRLNQKELFADAFSFIIYDPKNAKRISPNFYTYLNKNFKSLMKTIGQERFKQVNKIVKVLKGDKKFLAMENLKKKINKHKEELAKILKRKRIGPKTKSRIKAKRNLIEKLNKDMKKLK